MSRRVTILGFFVAAIAPGWLLAVEDPLAPLRLEAHGLASFGYLRSWRNDWLGETKEGTTEFWEAGVNAVARPADHLRIGAQVFARDLGRYDNGKVQLDWAYADWRHNDLIGVQVGRFKLPVGLYGEALDVDAGRASILLPPSVYALRTRDLFISADGGKVYGFSPTAGGLAYQLYLGSKDFDEDLGFGTYFKELGLGTDIDEISASAIFGGMIHWTPNDEIGFRLSFADVHGFAVVGSTPDAGLRTTFAADDYIHGVSSVVWEGPQSTWAAEYVRIYGRGTSTIEPLGLVVPFQDDFEGGYVSATWHLRPWLDLYAAGELNFRDPDDRSDDYSYTAVLATAFMPRPNWSLKAEFRNAWGTLGVSSTDEPDGADGIWQILALKTTLDF